MTRAAAAVLLERGPVAGSYEKGGIAVPDGATATLTFPCGKSRAWRGDWRTFRLSNTDLGDFETDRGGDQRGTGYPLRYRVIVTNEKGMLIPATDCWMLNMGGLGGKYSLAPGESFSRNSWLQQYAALGNPPLSNSNAKK